MYTRTLVRAQLLLRRLAQVASLAKAAAANSPVQGAVPPSAYLSHLLHSPLYYVLKAVGPAMAPAINYDVAERAAGQVRCSQILVCGMCGIDCWVGGALPVVVRARFRSRG
jgi:hypothetical protein